MQVVNIHEAKTNLSRLIAQAVAGDPFVIARAGAPLVKVSALGAPKSQKRLGFLVGAIVVPEDLEHVGQKA